MRKNSLPFSLVLDAYTPSYLLPLPIPREAENLRKFMLAPAPQRSRPAGESRISEVSRRGAI